MKSRTFIFITVALLVWAVMATSLATYYFTQYTQTTTVLSKVSIKVNVCINYGNGTFTWHNGTVVPLGSSAFNATTIAAKVKSTYYTGEGEFVQSIDGVAGNNTYYWSFWCWNSSKWSFSEVGASEYILQNGDVIGWRYTSAYPPVQPPS